METFKSNISNSDFPLSEKITAITIRKAIFEFIKLEHPKFTRNQILSISELNRYRQKYLENILLKEAGELSTLERDVLQSIENQELISANLLSDNNTKSSYGQRLADKVATFGGSWRFIMIFGFFILVWMIINIIFLATKAFDPYPFILLNLILS